MLAKGQITVTNLDDGKTPFLHQAYKMKDGRFLKHYPVYEASPINGYKEGDLWHRTDGSQPGYFVANKSNTTFDFNDWTFYASDLAYSDTDKFYPKFEGTYSDYNEVASDDQTKYTWKIIKADDGIGIKSLKEYYAVSTSNVTPPSLQSDWSETPKATDTTKKYLWNYEVYTYSNGDVKETTKRVIGTHGTTGATGNGITSVTNYYLATTLDKGVTIAMFGGNTEVQKTDPVKKYLWNYEEILYTNGSKIPTAPVIIGTHGEKGDTGPQGPKGDNAPLVKLSGATQIITQSNTGVRTPSASFTVVGTSVNTTVSEWTYSVNGGTFGTGLPAGVTRSGNTVTIAPDSITFNTLSIKATGGGVSDTFTVARIVDGEKGAKGETGSTGGTGSAGKDAYTVLLSNESHTFQAGTTNAVAGSTTTDIHAYRGTNKVAVTVGTITGMPTGMTGTIISNGTVNAGITFTVATNMTSPSGVVTIPLTIDGKIFNKEFSYALTFKGQNAVVGLLTNESITLPANKDGLVSNFTGANGVFDVYDGITKKTGTGVIYSLATQSNITVNIDATTGAYNVTAMPTGTTVLNGYATLKAIYNDVTIEKQLNVSKSLTGATGATGATGLQGPRGATGTSVSSVTEYYLATSESSGILSTDTRFTTAMQPMSADKKYLWNYEKINFSDSTSQPTIPVIIGVYGDKGQTGSTGATGRSIVSITEHYLATSASSGVTRSTSGWGTTMQPTTETNKYLWNYETINWSSGTTPTYVEPIIIGVHGAKGPQGPQGPQGVQGPKGADGKPTYTWVRYSPNANGSGMTNLPDANTKYIGIATNKTVETESNIASDYVWSKFIGDNGVPGAKGADGKTTYTWIKYADTATGTGMSNDPTGKLYMGISYNQLTATESNTASDYTWSLIKGEKGDKGDKGPQGPQGLQGLQGSKGDQGIQGPKGVDGKSSYTHIAYATGDQGQSFNHSTFPQATHIGIYVSDNQNSSGNWKDYKWTLIKGANGARGLEGPKGADGKTPYFHTAYANSADGKTDFSITDSDKKRYIGTATTYSDTNPSGADPKDPSKYKWVDMVGSVEVGGRNLLKNSKDFKYTSINGGWATYTSQNGQHDYTIKLDHNSTHYGWFEINNSDLSESIINNKNGNITIGLDHKGTVGFKYNFSLRTTSNTYPFGDSITKSLEPSSDWKRAYISIPFPQDSHKRERIYVFMTSLPGTVVGDTFSIRNWKVEKGNTATDWTPAPEDIQKEIKDVSDVTNTLKNFTNTAFVDGIIERAEAQAIREHLNTLKKENNDLLNQYSTLYTNVNLVNPEKGALLTARNNYANSYTSLVSIVNTAISGDRTTAAQKTAVDNGFVSYTNSLQAFTQKLSEAQTAIGAKMSSDIAIEEAQKAKSINYGYRYSENIIIHGDSDKYYPVVIKSGNQNIKRDILVMRSYEEQAPSDWYTSTHKGGLTLKIKANFGGWGGANYSWEIHELEEMYSRTFAGAMNVGNQTMFAIFLRGGGATGAIYHLFSDQPLDANPSTYNMLDGKIPRSPQIALNQDLIFYHKQGANIYQQNAPAYRTLTPSVEKEIRERKFIQLAQNTNKAIEDMSTDGKITPIEKVQLKKEWATILSEKTSIEGTATTFEVTTQKNSYNNSYNLLNNVLNGTSGTTNGITNGILRDMTTTTTLNATTFRSIFEDYYNKKAALYKVISEAARQQGIDASLKAENAQADATIGKNMADNLSNDSIITQVEKLELKREWDAIVKEKPSITTQATDYALQSSAEATAYNTAYNSLNGSIPTLLSKMNETSSVNRTTFNTNFANYYDKRQLLLNRIAKKAKELADVAQSSVDNLEIGGRNLIVNTESLDGYSYKTSDKYMNFNIARTTKGATGYTDTFSATTIDIAEGVTYTASFFARASVASVIVCHWYSPNTTIRAESSTGHVSYAVDGAVQVATSTEWKRYWVTWTQSTTTAVKHLIIGRNTMAPEGTLVEIAGVKLEKGNKATDWSPAPEDARTYKAWANSSEGSVDFTRVYPNENLFLVKEWEKLPERPYHAYISELEIQLEPSTEYTLSTNIPNWDDNTTCDLFLLDSQTKPNSVLNGVAINKPRTIKTLADGIIIVGCRSKEFSSGIDWAKLERGTTPTVYTTNPQDSLSGSIPKYVGFSPIDSDVSHEYEWIMNPEYAQALADEALAGKVDNDAEYENLKNMAQEVKESYEKFVGENGEYKTEHNKLLKRTTTLETDLGEYREQINFVDTYMSAGNEGLIIGVKDSEGKPDAKAMQMLLSNKSLSFMDNGDIVAYFSGQSFHINKGAIIESIQVGQHTMTDLGNGHTVFKYIG